MHATLHASRLFAGLLAVYEDVIVVPSAITHIPYSSSNLGIV